MIHPVSVKGLISLIFIQLVILLHSSVSSTENFRCPPLLQKTFDTCKTVNCGKVSKHACPLGTTYVDNFALCGCCPSCVRYHHPNDKQPCVQPGSPREKWIPDPLNCDEKEGFCPVKVNTCHPSLWCNDVTGQCELPLRENKPNRAEECMFRKYLRQLGLVHWDPDCEADGWFSPKQCKGSHYDGECFCVDREGNRIFGREWRINAENQTCACSRKVHEMRNMQGLIATFHCTPDGNFEPLQCDTDSGMCYCVDPQTGELDGGVLPESQWKSLACFSLNLTDNEEDGKYLRRCESEFAGLRQLTIIGSEHGFELQSKRLACDFDGSYAPVQLVHTQTQCVFKNGTKIRDYFMPENNLMTCNCARDNDQYLPSQNKTFDFSCEQRTGNYEIAYDFGSYSSCVDRDGFLYGDVVPSMYFCCLLKEGCSIKVGQSCYNDGANMTGYKDCGYWWYQN